MNEKVLIAGGSGMIGRRLTKHLQSKGYEVRWLTSSGKNESGVKSFCWNYKSGEMDLAALDGVDYIFNFAGAGVIEKPWTESYKKEILESRTGTAKLLLKGIREMGLMTGEKKIKSYISASAVGYYGDCGEEIVSETHSPAKNFLGTTCKAWEDGATQFADAGIRTCIIRIGIVLAKEGGALPGLMRGIKFGFAGYLGNGKQFYPWIHIDDLCREFIFLMENINLSGVYNGVAPNPVRNKELVKQISLAKSVRAILLPVPEFVLSLMLGKRKVTVLDSCMASSEKIQKTGFEFEYESLEDATKQLLKH